MNIKLYYHKTSGGAEYLMDTYIVCPNGHKEGCFNEQTKYCVRIDGNIEKDVELSILENHVEEAVVEEPKKINVPFSESDLQELQSGESFDWNFEGVSLHLFHSKGTCEVCGDEIEYAEDEDDEGNMYCESCVKAKGDA